MYTFDVHMYIRVKDNNILTTAGFDWLDVNIYLPLCVST